jgi:predicted transposase/invertase (TIGR01784 family)
MPLLREVEFGAGIRSGLQVDHDHSYKLLFSHQHMMADLIQGFITADWVKTVDFSTLELVSSSHMSDDLRARDDDLIWRVRRADGWLYIYLLLEFQARVDQHMAVRIMAYVALLYQGLIRTGQLTPAGTLPPVVPVVLYNGRGHWTASQNVETLVEPMPGGLELYRPRLSYLLIDEGRYTEEQLAPPHNIAAALFRLENSRTLTDVQRVVAALMAWLHEPAHTSLRRAFTVWLRRVLLPARLPAVSIPELQDLGEVQTMLAERVIEWTQQWKEEGLREGRREGRQQGLQEGRQQGLAAERTLLMRQARRRFGEACAEALAPLLARCEETEALAEVGE